MNKTRFQKVSRAAVASVLAASGTVAVLPINNVKAASPFTDVDPAHFAYDAIINLYERNIISGYGNGKFGPNDSVTRGQAAKMLAQVLELDTTSVVNPNFKDVKTTDPFYKYIAALANEGIINGFVDQTYRPNEPITRGQMAIVITRGFDFKQASLPLTHTFDDVTVNTYERFFIQTIYDLGITKGKTERTFEPYSRVTRGEMAVFINRAENARAIANPLYEVTNVHTMGNITYAYINGVKHTVDSSLKSIFNDANAAALEGALIEGKISDTKRIVSLSKMTFTAKGSESRSLQFNGGNSVFAGDVAITGSYLKFRNWSVTGEVSIEPETVRTIRAALEASPFKRVASLGNPFSFIDWGQETDPDDYDPIGGTGGNGDPSTGPADGSEDGSDLVSPPTNNESGYYKRMAPVQRYIEFIDVDIRYLVIRQTGTHVTSTNTLPHVTVTGNVKAYELYANVGTMYIETEVSTTMYGVSEIEEVYKNSHKSVNLDADTTIDLMIVDNSNGWIDLGEHSYIHTVIIPPNKMPNDIFNDFINDNDLIGDIEDPWGNEVDRDPIENTIVPDLEDPELRITNVEVIGNEAKITFNSNEDGEIYYIVRKKDDDIPSIRQILQNAGGKWSGKIAASEGIDVIATVQNLDDLTDYVVYAVSVDEAGNISDKQEREFRVADSTAPLVQILRAEPMNGKNNAEIEFQINEKGAVHYVIRFAEDEPPTVEDVKRLGKTFVVDDFTLSYTVRELGLNANTNYVVYMIGEDESKNMSPTVVSAAFMTGEADYDAPILINSTMDQDFDVVNWNGEEGRTEITLRFNEPLDPESATNIDNYELSGTGNLTGKPYAARLTNGGRNVILTIPSMAAFVDNDTLVVTINSVMDLAGNEIKPDTKAVLEFTTNREAPKVEITSVIDTEGKKNEQKDVIFEASVPGRYYYLVLPSGLPEDQKPKVRDIIFPEDYLTTQKNLGNVYYSIQGESAGGIINAPGENIIKGIAYDMADPDFKRHLYGYDIYLVMQNRDGKYTEQVVSHKFLSDTKHPQIDKVGFLSTVESTLINDGVMQTEITDKLGPAGLTFGNPITYETVNDDGSVEIVEYEMIQDPTTQEIKIQKTVTLVDAAGTQSKVVTDNTLSANFQYDVDADGNYNRETDKYFRYAIRFSEPMERATVEEASHYVLKGKAGEKLKVANVKLLSDEQTLVLDLEVAGGEAGYEEYALIDADDLVIHIRNAKDKDGLMLGGNTDPNTGAEILPGGENDPADKKNDVTFNYIDKIKPKLKSQNAIRKNPTMIPDGNTSGYIGNTVHEIELTFTEKVDVENFGTLEIVVQGVDGNNNDDGLPTTLPKSQYKIKSGTIMPSDKVIIEIIEQAPEEIEDTDKIYIKLDEQSFKDTASVANNVSIAEISQALYVYREMPLKIVSANIPADSQKENTASGPPIYWSRDIYAITELEYSGSGMTAYYVVKPPSIDGTIVNLTASEIMNATPNLSDNYGNKEVTNIAEGIQFRVSSPKIFRTGHIIYFVMADEYGNVSNVVSTPITKND